MNNPSKEAGSAQLTMMEKTSRVSFSEKVRQTYLAQRSNSSLSDQCLLANILRETDPMSLLPFLLSYPNIFEMDEVKNNTND